MSTLPLLHLPRELVHEILACLHASDMEAFALTHRAAHRHLCHDTRTLPPDRAFSRPLPVDGGGGSPPRPPRRYHTLFTTDIRQNLAHLRFRSRALLHLGAVSLPTTRMFLQCLYMTGERDAAAYVLRYKHLPASAVLGQAAAAAAAGPVTTPRQLRHLCLYRNLHWTMLLFAVVKHTLEHAPKLRELHISNLPVLVHHGSLVMASSQMFFVSLLQAARHRLRTLSLRGARYTASHADMWSAEAMEAARDAVQTIIDTDEWYRCRLFSQRRFCTATMGIGVCLVITQPHLVTLEIQEYHFNAVERAGRDVQAFIDFVRTSHLARLVLKSIDFVHGDDFLNVMQALDAVRTLQTLELVSIDAQTPPSADPNVALFRLARTRLKSFVFDFLVQWSVFPFPVNELLPAPSPEAPPASAAGPALRTLRIRRMYLDHVALAPFAQRLAELTSLVDLDLSYNALDGHFYPALAACLAAPHCRLRRLSLVGNLFSYLRADTLAAALVLNRTLVRLDMADNFLSYQGFRVLEQALRHNTSLRVVRLDRNSIRIAMDDLHDMLYRFAEVNTTLHHLSLKENVIVRCTTALASWRIGCSDLRVHV